MAGGVLNSGFLAEGVIRELLEKLNSTPHVSSLGMLNLLSTAKDVLLL